MVRSFQIQGIGNEKVYDEKVVFLHVMGCRRHLRDVTNHEELGLLIRANG